MSEATDFLEKMTEDQNRLYTAIGHYAANFAVLERHLNWAIGCLLNISERQRDILVDEIQNTRRRLDMFADLAYLAFKDKDQRDEIDEIIRAATEANTHRNDIVHNPWGAYVPLDDEWQKIRTRAKKGILKIKDKSYGPKEIHDLADEIIPLCGRLMEALKPLTSA